MKNRKMNQVNLIHFVHITSYTTLDWVQISQLARTDNHPITGRTWDDVMTYAT